MSEFKIGDRVKVVKVNWEMEPDEENIVGREGTVTDTAALFVRVRLDQMPAYWTRRDDDLPLVEDELEKL